MRECHYLIFSAMVLLFAAACDYSEDAAIERDADVVEKGGHGAGHHHGKGDGECQHKDGEDCPHKGDGECQHKHAADGMGPHDGDCPHKGDGKGPCDCQHKDGEECQHKADADCPHKHAADGKGFVDADGDGECDHHAKPADVAK